MLESRPGERDFHKQTLLQKLRQGKQTLGTQHLYTEERAAAILSSTATQSQMFASGLTEVHSGQSLREKERDVGKVVVLAVMDELGLAELERVLHLFSEVFVINLTVSAKEASQAMRVSPLRRKLKGFVQISLNFFPCLDGLFSINRNGKGRAVGFAEGLTSYLLSLPKFHEFHFHYSRSDNNDRLSAAVQQTLKSKVEVLQRHGCSQYKESGSPRVSVLLIDRKIDAMSPFLYSYFYGPIAHELGVLGEHEEFTTRSILYSTIFSMDIQEAGEMLRKLSAQRVQSKKATMEKNEVQQIKKAITLLCDTTASAKEIQIHLESLAAIRQFCQRRALATALQQTILNNLSEEGEKMSPSKIIDRLIEWSGMPLEEFQLSEEDYAKMMMVAYMVNSFWFFHRKIINAAIKDHPRRDQILTFCKRNENTYKPLPEKPQGEERYDLYRHQPAIVVEIDAWMKRSKEFQTRMVNQSSANRETRRVIAVDGPLGYNEACFIQRYFKEKEPNASVSIICSQLMNTKEYQDYLLRREANRP